jgi:hypothetical protein
VSGETERNISGWTTDTLREHITQLINEHDKRYEQRFLAQESAVQSALVAQEKAVNAALIAADRAVAKAEVAQDKRNEATNEFRGQLSDQAATLMPRKEVEQVISSLSERMQVELRSQDSRIDSLSKLADRAVGRNAGISSTWQIILGAGGFAAALATVLYTIHAVTGR